MNAPALVDLVALAERGLMLSVLLSLPVLAVAAAFGLLTAMFQAATQIHDAALSHLPKFLAITLVLGALGPWMGREIVSFARLAFGAP
jgi:flagellar biosynthesis protein FliQ